MPTGIRATLRKFQRLARYPLRQWPMLLVILAFTVASSAVAVLQPWPLKILVDFALQGLPLPTWLADLLADRQFGFLTGCAGDPGGGGQPGPCLPSTACWMWA